MCFPMQCLRCTQVLGMAVLPPSEIIHVTAASLAALAVKHALVTAPSCTAEAKPLSNYKNTVQHVCSVLGLKFVLLATEDEDNATILRDLFERTGIMSAIDHSKIESANDPETRAIDYEASRIARQAAEALRQSRRVSPSHTSHNSTLTCSVCPLS